MSVVAAVHSFGVIFYALGNFNQTFNRAMTPENTMSGSATSRSEIVVRRIRFASSTTPSNRVCRSFQSPRACVAVEEPATLAELPPRETGNELIVAFIPPTAATGWEKRTHEWFTQTGDPDELALDVKYRGDRIVWRPGFAAVYLGGEIRTEVEVALVEFAFYESELRRLEAEMNTRESSAVDDVPFTQTIHARDKARWSRFTETIEALARMRLALARLAPRLTEDPTDPAPRTRRLASRLLQHARAASRSESLDTRLEACEDLYEGANDRVADFRGWANGHFLEVIIVVLLLLEVFLLCAELIVRAID